MSPRRYLRLAALTLSQWAVKLCPFQPGLTALASECYLATEALHFIIPMILMPMEHNYKKILHLFRDSTKPPPGIGITFAHSSSRCSHFSL